MSDQHGGMPPEAASYVKRIKVACDDMLAIEDEVEALEHRIIHRDVAAIHLGVRRIAEALLQHACSVEGATAPEPPTLSPLAQALRERAKDRLGAEFWRQLNDVIIKKCNANAHFRGTDVYAPVLRHHNALDEIVQVLIALAGVAEDFVRCWPPPSEVTPEDAARSTETAALTAPDVAPEQAAAMPVASSAAPVTPAPSEEQRRYADVTVAQAREDQAARDWLARYSGLQQRGVSLRLNREHGRRKLRNVFEHAFPDHGAESSLRPREMDQAVRATEETPQSDIDFVSLGRLTVAQARELDVSGDIARITGYALGTVRNKLRELHGKSVIHRQFPWFDEEVVASMTASTALHYDLVSFLAVAWRESKASLRRKLEAVPGQTKLKNVFSQLDGAASSG